MEIENIVFEGGGVLGLAYIGCIKYLEEHDLLKNVKKISGSSIGGLFATSIAVGVSSDKLENILKNKNFKEFKDGSKLIFPNIFRLIFKGGYYKGDDLNNWLKKLFKIYVGKEDITFKEIYDIFGKELILTGSNMDKAKIIVDACCHIPEAHIKGRSNRGKSACGVLIIDEKGNEYEFKKYLGEMTAPEAEFKGLIFALDQATGIVRYDIEVWMDSELVVKWMTKKYRMKKEHIRPLFDEAKKYEQRFQSVEYFHHPSNSRLAKRVNSLANQAYREHQY